MRQFLDEFLATPFGQALAAFLRVTVAGVLGAWVNAGLPMSELTWGQSEEFLRVGLSAGAALVLANWFGPWEDRYGHKGHGPQDA